MPGLMDQLLTDTVGTVGAALAGYERGCGRDNRQFVEAGRWLARNGPRWRGRPKEQGESSYNYYNIWVGQSTNNR